MKTQKNKNSYLSNGQIKVNYAILFSACLFQIGSMSGQSLTYDNFEGTKSVEYTEKTGILDVAAENPTPNSINSSKKCAKYTRSSEQKFDNIKMNFSKKLGDIGKYATYSGIPSKISMKVYTTAPVGTLIEIQLGSKTGKKTYPEGINSQYQAYTTVSNAWEEVQFKFSQIPKGSETPVTQVDQITLLFNPNSSTKDTYYFDDISGPPVATEKSELLAVPAVSSKEK